jgi:hypothetical protein
MSVCSSVVSFIGLLSLFSSFFFWRDLDEGNQQGEERIIFLMTPPTQQCQLLLKTKKLICIMETHQKEERMETEGRNPIYVFLEREGAIRIVSYSGKIEGSDSHGEGLRKCFYQAYHMLKKVKSVNMSTC